MPGKELRAIRKKWGLTQNEFAALLTNYRYQAIVEYETNITPVPTVLMLLIRSLEEIQRLKRRVTVVTRRYLRSKKD